MRRVAAALLAAACVAAAPSLIRAADKPPAAAAAADSGAAPKETGPGYIVVDLPAIKRAIKASHGHPVLVHFWATWCYPCLQELPVIEKLARDLRPRGLEVLSLSLDDPQRAGARVSKVLSEVAPSLTRSIVRIGDADSFIGSFDGQWEGSIPALFAYDAQGQLRGHLIGEATRRELDELIGRVLKGPPPPAAPPRPNR